MKKSVKNSVYLLLLLFLLLPARANADKSLGDTQADVSFTQGDTPIIEPDNTSKKEEQKGYSKLTGFLPKTGEAVRDSWMLMGIGLVGFVGITVRKKTGKNNIKK